MRLASHVQRLKRIFYAQAADTDDLCDPAAHVHAKYVTKSLSSASVLVLFFFQVGFGGQIVSSRIARQNWPKLSQDA